MPYLLIIIYENTLCAVRTVASLPEMERLDCSREYVLTKMRKSNF